MSIDIITSTTQ